MASGFPGSIDNFTDPLSNSSLSSPSHAGQHADLNDAVEKIETYMGLVKVIPTSVSTGNTLAANGTITIGSARSEIIVDGCFTSLYDNYRLVVTGTTPSSNTLWQCQWRSGASTVNAANYQHAALRIDSTGTTYNFGANGQTYNETAVNIYSTINGNGFTYDVFSPYLAQETAGQVSGAGTLTGVSLALCATRYGASTSITGFRLYPAAGTVTGGTIRVYGYRN